MVIQKLTLKNRETIGKQTSIVGFILTLCISIIEFFVGMISHSSSIIADAFHNLSDTVSSLISFISFKISEKNPTQNYKFGFGRIEFLSQLFIGILLGYVGISFIQTSIQHIIHPQNVHFNFIVLCLIAISIIIKIIISEIYNNVARKINSQTLKASAIDATTDIIVLIIASLSIFLSLFGVQIDGWLNLGISLFIIYSAFEIIKSSVEFILGKSNKEIEQKINKYLLENEHVENVYDIFVHNYGSRIWCSCRLIPKDSVADIPKFSYLIEKDIESRFGIHNMCIHISDEQYKTAK